MSDMKDKYNCLSCANKSSPLCELCTHVKSPNGIKRKPKYYIALTEPCARIVQIHFPYYKAKEQKRAALAVAKYLCSGVPIPISIVLEYNKLTERKEIKEGEQREDAEAEDVLQMGYPNERR